jgi:electron transfer flavoprotein alpha subunit
VTGALRVAVLAKQVPAGGTVDIDAHGKVRRDGAAEINPYCRRAIAHGVALARQTGGSCTVLTMGPPSAVDVPAEAIACGADRGVLVSDADLAGADLLVTAKALAAALRAEGPFELVLVGHSSLDAETAQLGPQLAGLLGWAFAGAARTFALTGDGLAGDGLAGGGLAGGGLAGGGFTADCEQDHQLVEVRAAFPAVIAVAERLCAPAKAPGHPPAHVPVRGLRQLPGALPSSASPTVVGRVVPVAPARAGKLLDGSVADQVAAAVAYLAELGALDGATVAETRTVAPRTDGPTVAVLADSHHPGVLAELLGLAADLGGRVQACCGPGESRATLGWQGADLVYRWSVPEPAPAATASALSRADPPDLVLVPATAWGREVAGRYAAAVGAGLIADAVGVQITGGRVVAEVCGFGGKGLVEVASHTRPTVVTVRPGVLPVLAPREAGAAEELRWAVARSAQDVTEVRRRTLDDWSALSRAAVVVGVGQGVDPADHGALRPLLDVLGAQLAGTRKLTDSGALPRSRQIGATGRSIRPRLYVAIGLSGRPHHLAGVAGAGTVLAINVDPAAPVFAGADLGIVAPWQEAVPALAHALSRRAAG